MQICHLILAHKNPEQLKRLTQALTHPSCHIYVHLDKKADEAPYRDLLNNAPNVFFVKNRVKVYWGGFSIVMAVANAIEEIGASGISYDFINLISAQDYPIKSMQQLVNFLEAHKGKNFISYANQDDDGKKWMEHSLPRFQEYHLNEFTFKGKYLAQRLINRLLPRRRFPSGWKMFGGNYSTWWILDANCAYYVARVLNTNKRLRRFLKFTWGSDEMIFITIIMNSHFAASVQNDIFRYIDWSEGKASPKTLTCADIDALQQPEHFFARKFDMEIDSTVLDLIDSRVLS